MCENIVAHLEMLSKSLDGYFVAGELKTSGEWIMNPYSYNLDNMSADDELKEDLIDLHTNCALEMELEIKTLEEYWCSAINMFPRFCKKHLVSLSYLGRHTYVNLDLVLFCQLKQNLEIA